MQTHHRNSRIAVVETTNRGGNDKSAGFENIKPDMTVEDRYYTPQEYAKLSVAKKNGLRAKRKKRGHSGEAEGGKSQKRLQRANKRFDKRVVSAIRRISKEAESDSDSSESNTETGNKAILRRREE